MLDGVNHVLDELEHLLFRGLSRLALRTHLILDGFGLLDDALDQQRVLLLPLMRLSLVAVLQLGEVRLKLVLELADRLTALLGLPYNLILHD